MSAGLDLEYSDELLTAINYFVRIKTPKKDFVLMGWRVEGWGVQHLYLIEE